jgi:glycosyltransferase involved in cell wall biosynthesis
MRYNAVCVSGMGQQARRIEKSGRDMRIGIDVTAAVRQGAGIGRFTRELIRAYLALDLPDEHILFAATGGMPAPVTNERLDYITGLARRSCSTRRFPLTDDWLHRLWHRARLPVPIEALMGRVGLLHEPDFVLPPTLPRTPTVLTVHDLTFIRDAESALPKLRRYLSRVVPRSVARATHVLADSIATKTDLIELLRTPAEKITVLYGGVDARFAPVRDPDKLATVRARYNIGSEPFVLGLGTIQPRKNYERLVQAFANLLALEPLASNLRLVIVGGKGWLYDSIFAQVKRLGVADRVMFPGFVDDHDLPALYSAATLFAFPSIYEGFGLPVLEAMACGTPVVTSNTSSLVEVGGDAALLVEPTNVDAIADAMRRILQGADLQRTLTTRGFEQARRFTWEKAALQLREIYERIGTT